MSRLNVETLNVSNSAKLPSFTSANRPSQPEAGLIIYNSTINNTEIYDGSNWVSYGIPTLTATGGTISASGVYTIHTFTGSGTFNVTSTSGSNAAVEVLVVGGGGAGGQDFAGGGGGGGVIYSAAYPVSTGAYTVTIGAGGNRPTGGSTQGLGTTAQGGSSSFGSLTAVGGGGGAGSASGNNAGNGGSGGGARDRVKGVGTSGQGNHGGIDEGTFAPASSSMGGGGGGAGGPGLNDGRGGNGRPIDISGTVQYYGGGGGGSDSGGSGPAGGLGGGGTKSGFQAASNNGSPNTGGGGSGFYGPWNGAGNGGSGIVIVRYKS